MISLKKIIVFGGEKSKARILDCFCEVADDIAERRLIIFDIYLRRWNISEFIDNWQQMRNYWDEFYNFYEGRDSQLKSPKFWHGYRAFIYEGEKWIVSHHKSYLDKNDLRKEFKTATHYLKLNNEEMDYFLHLKKDCGIIFPLTYFKKCNFENALDLIPKKKMIKNELKNLKSCMIKKVEKEENGTIKKDCCL